MIHTADKQVTKVAQLTNDMWYLTASNCAYVLHVSVLFDVLIKSNAHNAISKINADKAIPQANPYIAEIEFTITVPLVVEQVPAIVGYDVKPGNTIFFVHETVKQTNEASVGIF